MQGGSFECGTETDFFAGSLVITLTGPKPASGASDAVGGDKSIAGLAGGKLSLHGAKRSSWTRLASPANVGDSQITIQVCNSRIISCLKCLILSQDAMDWQVGDAIVVATTALANSGVDITKTNEVFSITAISGYVISLVVEIS